MTRTLTLAFLMAVAACGGKDKGAATTTTTEQRTGSGEHGGEHAGQEHHELTPELKAFHDILSPLWHTPEGAPQRITDTCAAIERLTMEADAVAKATPPVPANADTWTAGTRALVTAVAALENECTAKNPGRFEVAFAKVHDAFHALMAQAEPHG